MGMCARCEGFLYVKAEHIDYVKSLLAEDYIFPDYEIGGFRAAQNVYVINLFGNDGYRDDKVKMFLKKIQLCIVGGEIEYIGDCYEMWRFLFSGLEWYEEESYAILYDPRTSKLI